MSSRGKAIKDYLSSSEGREALEDFLRAWLHGPFGRAAKRISTERGVSLGEAHDLLSRNLESLLQAVDLVDAYYKLRGEKGLDEMELEIARIRAARHKPKNKKKAWATALASKLLEDHPGATARELWNEVPGSTWDNAPDEPNLADRWIVYRDGDELCAVEERTGKKGSIRFDAFRKYVGQAKHVQIRK